MQISMVTALILAISKPLQTLLHTHIPPPRRPATTRLVHAILINRALRIPDLPPLADLAIANVTPILTLQPLTSMGEG